MKHTQEGISCLKQIKQQRSGDDLQMLANCAIEQIDSFLPTLSVVSQYLERTSTIVGAMGEGLGVIEFCDKARELAESFEKKHKDTVWEEGEEELIWDVTLYEFLIAKEEGEKVRLAVHGLFFH
jgi:hypothetical protein